ncbi:hypothetical protein GGI35DRAFT_205969 [Trichoderma velutinum]
MPSRRVHGQTGSQVIGLGTPEPTPKSLRGRGHVPVHVWYFTAVGRVSHLANKGVQRGIVPSRASSASLSLRGTMRHSCPVASVDCSAASARKWRQRGGFENRKFRALVATDGTTSMGRQTVPCSLVVIPAASWVVLRCCAWLETDIRHLSFVQDTRQTADQPAPETKLRGLCFMGCTIITYKVRSTVLVRMRAHVPTHHLMLAEAILVLVRAPVAPPLEVQGDASRVSVRRLVVQV